jgi:hypothetical protein
VNSIASVARCWFLGGAAMWIDLIDTMMHMEDKEKTEEAEFSQLCGCRLGSVPPPRYSR